MLRLWVMSDLHLDINWKFPFAMPEPRPAHDAVVIAGDIGEGLAAGVGWIAAQRLNAVPVIYVAGNHEFYARDRFDELVAGRNAAAQHRNIHILERDELTIGNIRILGCTLWTDYTLYGDAEQAMRDAGKFLSDHAAISNNGRRWTPYDARAEHSASRDWLASRLQAEHSGATVVVTHHLPTEQSVAPRFRANRITPAFASNLDHLVGEADVWIHGHTHAAFDYRLGKCRVVNNPRGYLTREQTGFRNDLIVEVG